MKKIVVIGVVSLILIPTIALAGPKPKNAVGIGFSAGQQIPNGMIWSTNDYSWDYIAIHPSYGWLFGERWQIDLEGNIGQYQLKCKEGDKDKIFTIGFAVMANYDFWQFKNLSTYLDFGAGIGYWNKAPNNGMVVRSKLPGLIQYGAGLKFKLAKDIYLKSAYRFMHYSGIFDNSDSGANTHGVILKIIQTF